MEQSMMTATDAPLKRLCSSSATQSCCNGISATRHPHPHHPSHPVPPTRHAIRCHLMLQVWHGESFKFCILTYTHLLLCCVLCTVLCICLMLHATCCMPHAGWFESFVFMLQRVARKCVNNEDANSLRSLLNRKCNQVAAEGEVDRLRNKA